MAMKNTPFKMNGFSGFGNSPLRDTDPPGSRETPKASMMGSHVYREKGYTDKKKKKRKKRSNVVYKALKFLGLYGGAKHGGNPKIACGPGGCK